jgi:sugar phosphate isomerase/epimerase
MTLGGHLPYRFAARLNSFRENSQAPFDIQAAIQQMAQVDGISALELNYPQHFRQHSAQELALIAASLDLAITAINLRYDDQRFALGAFTNPDRTLRNEAIALTADAAETAVSLGASHVILWMGPDGFDYPFQADYASLWRDEIDGFRQIASRFEDLSISVEYKPSDPRRHSLIRSMGDALYAAAQVDRPNFGVTLDLCHSLMAGEHPPAAAGIAIEAGRLFGIHLNDGYGQGDDGLFAGAVHPWSLMELLLLLKRANFNGTLYFDTFPDRVDPAKECQLNIETVLRLHGLLDDRFEKEIEQGWAQQDGLNIRRAIVAVLGNVSG